MRVEVLDQKRLTLATRRKLGCADQPCGGMEPPVPRVRRHPHVRPDRALARRMLRRALSTKGTEPVTTRKKNAPNDLALRTARIEATLRHSELADRERLVLHAYLHFEPEHGGACGQPGVCWPTDGELGAYLGRSDVTTRRARRWLAKPGDGIAPFIAVRYVPPFHKLPEWRAQRPRRERDHAARNRRHGDRLEPRRRAPSSSSSRTPTPRCGPSRRSWPARASACRISPKPSPKGRIAAARRGGSHNAPSRITLGWSLLRGGGEGRAGERAQLTLSQVA